MKNAYIIDAIRTPFGRYAGGLAPVRADDLGAVPLKALMERNPSVDWNVVDDVLFGCANQAGEDNRNVGRMSALLAGIPYTVPATTVNRLCGSSLDTVAMAARAIKAGEADVIVAGGVESMSRAPFVMGKSESAFGRSQRLKTPPWAGVLSTQSLKKCMVLKPCRKRLKTWLNSSILAALIKTNLL